MHCRSFDFEMNISWVSVSFCFENIHTNSLIYVSLFGYRPSHLNHKSVVVDQSVLFGAIVQYDDLQQVPKKYAKVNQTDVISEVTMNILHVCLLK